MTQPTDEPPSTENLTPSGDRTLLARLEKASNADVSEASRTVQNFSPEDAEAELRRTKSKTKKTLGSIKRCFFWFLLILVCVMIAACAAAYLYLIWLWLGTVLYGTEVHDAKALKSFIDSVLWSLLIIFATLFFEGVFKDRD